MANVPLNASFTNCHVLKTKGWLTDLRFVKSPFWLSSWWPLVLRLVLVCFWIWAEFKPGLSKTLVYPGDGSISYSSAFVFGTFSSCGLHRCDANRPMPRCDNVNIPVWRQRGVNYSSSAAGLLSCDREKSEPLRPSKPGARPSEPGPPGFLFSSSHFLYLQIWCPLLRLRQLLHCSQFVCRRHGTHSPHLFLFLRLPPAPPTEPGE